MHLEARTTITREQYRRFVKTVLKKNNVMWGINRILYPLLLVLCLYKLWQSSAGPFWIVLVTLVSIGNAYALSRPHLAYILGFQRLSKSGLTRQFVFEDESFEVVNNSNSRILEHTTVQYDGLSMAFDGSEDFFLLVGIDHTFLVSKRDFTAGDPNELTSRLAATLITKYVKIK